MAIGLAAVKLRNFTLFAAMGTVNICERGLELGSCKIYHERPRLSLASI